MNIINIRKIVWFSFVAKILFAIYVFIFFSNIFLFNKNILYIYSDLIILIVITFLFIHKILLINNFKTWKDKILFLMFSLFFVYKRKIKKVKTNSIIFIIILMFIITTLILILWLTFINVKSFIYFLLSKDHIEKYDIKTRIGLVGKPNPEIRILKYVIIYAIPRWVSEILSIFVLFIFFTTFLTNIFISYVKTLNLKKYFQQKIN
ncbi:Uncharacterised protein [Mesomycoplasma neurolyticum]|uniref:Uncharacterized protein n=2 Tax=Mesomycoplasma neurolyticum TaxID=2120 RepID=A0A449A561_9BACT|nr:Uncharacterised protein [Mesomycoplasma neurolyticum]